MSALEPPDASTEPRGLPLGLLRQEMDVGMDDYVDVGEQVRSRLVSTTIAALASVVVLAGAGTLAAGQAWLPADQVSIVVGVVCVLISLAALGRAYFVSRAIRPVRVGPSAAAESSGRPDGFAAMPGMQEPVPDNAQATQTRQAFPSPAAPWTNAADFDSAEPGTGLELRREVFGKLAYRLQSLVNRLIHRIDQVEQEIEDPELLKSLYAIDHLATRIRRQIENLAVLGGEAPQRRSDIPVEANAVLRAAVAEIERYTEVTAVPIHEVKIRGHVVAEIIHLLAELLENATTFTTPGAPKVMLRAHVVTAGLAIQVQDRGIGLSNDDIVRINRLLNGSTQVDVGQLLQDGRIGLAVVEILARRHMIGAELQPNIFGGTDASIVIPHELLSERGTQESAPRDALPDVSKPRHAATSAAPSRQEAPAPAPVPTAAPRPAASGAAATTARPPYPAPAQPQPGVPGREQPQGAPPSPAPMAAQAPRHADSVATQSTAGQLFRDNSAVAYDAEPRHGDDDRSSGSLPVRRRGENLSKLRTGGADDAVVTANGDAGAASVTGTASATEQTTHDGPPPVDRADRPALPQRRGSYMREELREPPEPTRSIPGHNASLMASFLEGRGSAEEDEPDAQERDAQQQDQNQHKNSDKSNDNSNTEGDSASWPT